MGPAPTASVAPAPFVVGIADAVEVAAYRRLRYDAFVDDQGLFDRTDVDHLDQDHRTVVLVARATDGSGAVLGGVRVAPATVRDIGWWTGSRLVVGPAARNAAGVGSALVRAACALVEQRGALRFDALVQERAAALFTRIGWQPTGREALGGVPHLRMRWPVDRYQRLVDATKAHLAALFAGDRPGGAGWVGDDGAPLAGTDVIAACDAILPSMVERDPEWAGWCGVLVNVNDLTAMGAAPTALDATPRSSRGSWRGCAAPPTPGASRSSAATRRSASPPHCRSRRSAGPSTRCPAAARGRASGSR